MTDEFVSKEAVLELLCRECAENCTGGTPYRCYDPCVEWKLIHALPAANVREVKRGKCTNEARCFFCSECGYGVQDVYEGNNAGKNEVLVFERGEEWNFCPNCGADMSGGGKR